MSTRSKTAVLLASAGVLAAGWQIGTAQGQTALLSTDAEPTSQTTEAPTTTSTLDPSDDSDHHSDDSESDDSDDSTPSTQTSQATQTGSGITGTFTGATATNRYGAVTVTVTLQGGNVTDVQARATVYERHSQRYVQRALPILRSEVIAADSAQVSNVSGSTYTSQAYLTSLQSALDKAGR